MQRAAVGAPQGAKAAVKISIRADHRPACSRLAPLLHEPPRFRPM
jgi:hypothetical protein